MRFNNFCKLTQTLIPISAIVLVGCSSGESSLSDSEKASKMAEVISNTEVCAVYKDKLTVTDGLSILDAAAIDEVYFEALKAGCVKKDI